MSGVVLLAGGTRQPLGPVYAATDIKFHRFLPKGDINKGQFYVWSALGRKFYFLFPFSFQKCVVSINRNNLLVVPLTPNCRE